jgi:uncharacterized protein YgiM (DUF1202 family)
MKRFLLIVAVFGLLASGLSVSMAQQQGQGQVQGSWRAEFFNNPFLAAPIAGTANYNEINFDWGTGAPLQGVNADNFSAHFFADIYFQQAGTYRFTIQGDDSYQLIIDQQTVLRTFEEQNPVGTRTVDVQLTEGVHQFQLDYREVSGNAFLRMNWQNTAQITATAGATNAPTGTTATVSAFTLNVRAQPNTTAAILTKISAGQSFPVISTSADNNWVQLNANGTVGWVSANFVRISGAPVPQATTTPTQAPDTSAPGVLSATVTASRLNVRAEPNATASVLTQVTSGQSFTVLVTSPDNNWVQINANGTTGWVSANFVRLSGQPASQATPAPTQTTDATATSGPRVLFNVNLRAAPNGDAEILQIIPRNSGLQVLGRNQNSDWLQVTFNGVTGWVSAPLVTGVEISTLSVQQ